jgi:hypothetical protein
MRPPRLITHNVRCSQEILQQQVAAFGGDPTNGNAERHGAQHAPPCVPYRDGNAVEPDGRVFHVLGIAAFADGLEQLQELPDPSHQLAGRCPQFTICEARLDRVGRQIGEHHSTARSCEGRQATPDRKHEPDGLPGLYLREEDGLRPIEYCEANGLIVVIAQAFGDRPERERKGRLGYRCGSGKGANAEREQVALGVANYPRPASEHPAHAVDGALGLAQLTRQGGDAHGLAGRQGFEDVERSVNPG